MKVIAGVVEGVCAFGWVEAMKQIPDTFDKGIDSLHGLLPRERHELGRP